jgi:AcrR family transcriptional regulator
MNALAEDSKPGPGPGRPRSAAADTAILDAALSVFADAGLDGMTMEGVAARAGVGKATIYRRYPSKVQLVLAAARSLSTAEAPQPDTGSFREDLRLTARGLVHLLRDTVAGFAVRQLVAELDRNAELRDAHAEFLAGRRANMATAVQRGVERGELSPDTDAEMVADLIAGPIFYRHLVLCARLDGAYAEELVEGVLSGLMPGGATPGRERTS